MSGGGGGALSNSHQLHNNNYLNFNSLHSCSSMLIFGIFYVFGMVKVLLFVDGRHS